MPTVDIVLTYHNGSKFIETQLHSIINSDLDGNTNVHVIVIDDASKDSEAKILKELCEQYPNVRIERNNQNFGVIKSFEQGLQLSKSDYVMLSDQDDLWLPDKIQSSLNMLRQVETSKAALVFSDLCVANENLESIRPLMLQLDEFNPAIEKNRILFRNIVAGCTIIANRKLLELALPFPDRIPMHDHWLAVCAAFGGNIAMLNRPTLLYRQHDNNLVGDPSFKLFFRILSLRKTLAQLDESLEIKSGLAISLANRLEERSIQADTAALRKIAGAFKHRSLRNLAFLASSRVLHSGFVRLAFTSLAYLLTSPLSGNKARKIARQQS